MSRKRGNRRNRTNAGDGAVQPKAKVKVISPVLAPAPVALNEEAKELKSNDMIAARKTDSEASISDREQKDSEPSKANRNEEPAVDDTASQVPKKADKPIDQDLEGAFRRLDEKQDLKISKEEADNFRKAFDEPEFRRLFEEYVKEISDPKYRAEQNEYLEQLMNEHEGKIDPNSGESPGPATSLTGKMLIKPEPHFVAKFKYTTIKPGDSNEEAHCDQLTQKAFVNVVSSNKIAEPTMKGVESDSFSVLEGDKHHWKLPYCTGPIRMELSKSKAQHSPTVDCCFHPLAFKFARASSSFRDMMIDTAREGIHKALQANITRTADRVIMNPSFGHILRGIKYRYNEPPMMVVAQEEKKPKVPPAPKVAEVKTQPVVAVSSSSKKAKKSKGSGLKKGFLMPKKKQKKCKVVSKAKNGETFSDLKLVSSKPLALENPSTGGEKFLEPHYTLTESTPFDLMPRDETSAKTSRPKHLVAKINLPNVSSPSEVRLDISGRLLELVQIVSAEAKKGSLYKLKLRLPYPTCPDKSIAKWNSADHTLTVTMSVQVVVEEPIAVVSPSDIAPEQEETKYDDESCPYDENMETAATLSLPDIAVTDDDVLDEIELILNEESAKDLPKRSDYALEGRLPTSQALSSSKAPEPEKAEEEKDEGCIFDDDCCSVVEDTHALVESFELEPSLAKNEVVEDEDFDLDLLFDVSYMQFNNAGLLSQLD